MDNKKEENKERDYYLDWEEKPKKSKPNPSPDHDSVLDYIDDERIKSKEKKK